MHRKEICKRLRIPGWYFDSLRTRGLLPFTVVDKQAAEIGEAELLALATQLAVVGRDRATNEAARRFTLAALPLLPEFTAPEPISAVISTSRQGDLWIAEESIGHGMRHSHFRHHAGFAERIFASSNALNARDRHGGFERLSIKFCNVSAVARAIVEPSAKAENESSHLKVLWR